MDADVVVIGAGALGLSTALHAALPGRSVVVIERHTAGSQASGRAAGLFKSVQADELRTTLARRSIERAVTFADWAGVPLDVRRSGSSSSLALGEALAGWICGQPGRLDIGALSPARFGPLTEDELVSGGIWQYAHYYDPE